MNLMLIIKFIYKRFIINWRSIIYFNITINEINYSLDNLQNLRIYNYRIITI